MSMLVSRAQTGLVRPRSASKDVHPERGGVAVHWAGEPQRITTHTQCTARWRDWQRFHMDVRGWVDIAYNWGVCDHGYVLVGRGWGVRSAANGTDDANDRYLAACWLGGKGEAPTALALAAFESLIADCRRRGAARYVKPHLAFYGTECPGPVLTQMCGKWASHPLDGARPLSTIPPARPVKAVVTPPFPLGASHYFGPGDVTSSPALKPWQTKVGIVADGVYGPVTKAAALKLQERLGLARDARIGPATWGAAWRTR